MNAPFGLVGHPLGHSFSREIHESFGRYAYELVPLPPEELAPFFRARAFRGVNVTIPYKQAVIPFLDELSPRARAIGAVNTVLKRADGSLFGDNTDFCGLSTLARRAGIPLSGKVVVFGNGGTSRTARAAAPISPVAPAPKTPWCAHTTTRRSFIFSAVLSASSRTVPTQFPLSSAARLKGFSSVSRLSTRTQCQIFPEKPASSAAFLESASNFLRCSR